MLSAQAMSSLGKLATASLMQGSQSPLAAGAREVERDKHTEKPPAPGWRPSTPGQQPGGESALPSLHSEATVPRGQIATWRHLLLFLMAPGLWVALPAPNRVHKGICCWAVSKASLETRCSQNSSLPIPKHFPYVFSEFIKVAGELFLFPSLAMGDF